MSNIFQSGESILQGQLDLNGAVVDIFHNRERPGLEWILRITTSTACTPLEVAVQSSELVSTTLSGIQDFYVLKCKIFNFCMYMNLFRYCHLYLE